MAKHLEERNGLWFAVLTIPKDCRAKLNNKLRFVQSLKTHSKKQAETLAPRYVSLWKSMIEGARGNSEAILKEAEWMRKTLSKYSEPYETEEFLTKAIPRSEEIARTVSEKDGMAYLAIASGALSPLSPHRDGWEKSLTIKAKTKDQMVRDVDRFLKEFKTIQSMTSKSIKAWVDLLSTKGATPSSVNRQIKSARSLFDYLKTSGVIDHIAIDPFEGMSKVINKSVKKDVAHYEPFAISDVVKLYREIKAREDYPLLDIFCIGAYTGCRINEIAKTKIVDVDLKRKCFKLHEAKNEASIREVPLHNDLLPLIKRLIKESKDGYLIYSEADNQYGNRSAPLSQRFTRVKKSLKYGDQHVFHSLRGTVATLLENAKIPENIAADIVGHKKKTMTYGLYSGGTSLKNKLEALNKIKYPTLLNSLE